MIMNRRDLLKKMIAVFTVTAVGVPIATETLAKESVKEYVWTPTKPVVDVSAEIQKYINEACEMNMFEVNDDLTRTRVRTYIANKIRNNLLMQRHIYDYTVCCDATNNVPSVIDSGEFVVDVYYKPTRGVNYYHITARMINTNIDIEKVI